mmetsp:Transcript_40228/g.79495  ORF Transcript_40228/g.79495 Transcript_40228/m.79495 type:complete len:121 (-) Transcript_40228:46-408(-)
MRAALSFRWVLQRPTPYGGRRGTDFALLTDVCTQGLHQEVQIGRALHDDRDHVDCSHEACDVLLRFLEAHTPLPVRTSSPSGLVSADQISAPRDTLSHTTRPANKTYMSVILGSDVCDHS